MKTVLITGGNKGIGREVAKQLLSFKNKIILGSRDLNKGQEAIDKLGSGNNITHLNIDVSDEKSILFASKVIGEMGIKIDVLINNAAILIDTNKIDNMSADLFLETIRTNTLGPILMIQNFLKHMNRDSRIINVSSGAGSLSDMADFSPAYSISKTALNAVTKQFSAALSEKNISVNSVCPGWVRTDMEV